MILFWLWLAGVFRWDGERDSESVSVICLDQKSWQFFGGSSRTIYTQQWYDNTNAMLPLLLFSDGFPLCIWWTFNATIHIRLFNGSTHYTGAGWFLFWCFCCLCRVNSVYAFVCSFCVITCAGHVVCCIVLPYLGELRPLYFSNILFNSIFLGITKMFVAAVFVMFFGIIL